MQKILRLKSWVTLGEAAEYLTSILSEEVSQSDLLQFALEGHLTLSASFPNKARAKRGKVVPLEEVEIKTVPGLDGNLIRFIAEDQIAENQFLRLEDAVQTIEGIFDLPMIGAERLDIKHQYQHLTGGPEVTLVCLGGVLLRDPEGTIWSLQEMFDRKSYKDPASYFPAGGLPEDSVLVVRTPNLRRFEAAITGATEAVKERPLGERERASYQRIIGAMLAELTSRVDHDPAKPKPRYKTQSDLIAELVNFYPAKEGLSRSKLESVFADAKRALDSD